MRRRVLRLDALQKKSRFMESCLMACLEDGIAKLPVETELQKKVRRGSKSGANEKRRVATASVPCVP